MGQQGKFASTLRPTLRPVSLPGRRDSRPAVWVAALLLLLGLVVGYVIGERGPRTEEADVACMSAELIISCSPLDSPGHGEYWVPLDVAWTKNGTLHPSGRPECLPPVSRGVIEVRVTWTEVDVEGSGWKQVVGVHC